MKLTTKKVAWRIYEIVLNGRTFQIDGQNHYGQSNEWELFELVDSAFVSGELVWLDTYPTKKIALNDLPSIL